MHIFHNFYSNYLNFFAALKTVVIDKPFCIYEYTECFKKMQRFLDNFYLNYFVALKTVVVKSPICI